MKVRILKPFRHAGKEYYPPSEADFDPELAEKLIERGFAEKIEEAATPKEIEEPTAPASGEIDFNAVSDIGDVLRTAVGGEGKEHKVDQLIGIPIVITDVVFDKGQSGRVEGKDVVVVQILKQDGSKGWFSTWSGPLIRQLQRLVELKALPVRCKIEQKQSSGGYRFYTLASAKK